MDSLVQTTDFFNAFSVLILEENMQKRCKNVLYRNEMYFTLMCYLFYHVQLLINGKLKQLFSVYTY